MKKKAKACPVVTVAVCDVNINRNNYRYIMYDRKLQEKAGKGSAKEESLNLNIINAGAVKSGAN